ncbi:MAG: MBOAT family O-acyltransferase [Hyphomicrobiaceae bacterium]
MVFSSIEFLFFFLPTLLTAYFLSPARLKNAVLLLGSLIFYAWGGGELVFILMASVIGNYIFGAMVHRPATRRIGLVLAIVFNIGILFFFKYFNFFIEQIWNIPGLFEGKPWFDKIILPIGISFYTFQALSYVIDVDRGEKPPARSIWDFALYLTMFPQLIAGPIVKYALVADQLHDRAHSIDKFNLGAYRFLHGLFKKVVVADSIGAIADAAFNPLYADNLGMAGAWIGLLAYTLQIYFDFSAYSDMAIGLGLMLGFNLPENFNRPYSAVSITDFWRRWHMTLSHWFRDYLYIPLGGSRAAEPVVYRNLMIVFLATGIWHGANWTFVLWGIYHGMLLLIERWAGTREPTSRIAWHRAATLLLVMLGWVIFRAENVDVAFAYYRALFDVTNPSLNPEVAEAITNRGAVTLVLASVVFLLPGSFVAGRWLTRETDAVRAGSSPHQTALHYDAVDAYRLALLIPILAVVAADVISGTFSPFLYFQF